MKVTYRKSFDLGCGALRKEKGTWNYTRLSNYQVNKRNKRKKFSQGKVSHGEKNKTKPDSKQNNRMHERKKI